MTRQVIQRDRLGVLTKIGQSGQGVVFGAPNVKTKFASSMVYKEYKAQALAEIELSRWPRCRLWCRTHCPTPKLNG